MNRAVIALLLFLCLGSNFPGAETSFDVVIYGSTPREEAAAISDASQKRVSLPRFCEASLILALAHFLVGSSFQMSTVRALTSGRASRVALGTGSYHKVALDQSSLVSASPR
jgi:hypothetical protein